MQNSLSLERHICLLLLLKSRFDPSSKSYCHEDRQIQTHTEKREHHRQVLVLRLNFSFSDSMMDVSQRRTSQTSWNSKASTRPESLWLKYIFRRGDERKSHRIQKRRTLPYTFLVFWFCPSHFQHVETIRRNESECIIAFRLKETDFILLRNAEFIRLQNHIVLRIDR